MKIDRVGDTEDGEPVHQFSFENGAVEVVLLSYGASLRALRTPDRHGRRGDVVLGFETLEEYLADQPHFGATVGRFANRISGSRFLSTRNDQATKAYAMTMPSPPASTSQTSAGRPNNGAITESTPISNTALCGVL